MPTREYNFYVYILSSRSRNLYIGITNNLRARITQHRTCPERSHTAQYNIHRLIYFERFQYVRSAIARETELKKWTRAKKIGLIEKVNPTWMTWQHSGSTHTFFNTPLFKRNLSPRQTIVSPA